MRLIDADRVIKAYCSECLYKGKCNEDECDDDFVCRIKETPTVVVDGEVRCKCRDYYRYQKNKMEEENEID